MEQTFGSYVREKRMARGLSLRGLAAKLEVSPVYMSNMENDRRPAPTKEKMDRLIEILGLCQADTELLLDLAAKSKRNGCPRTCRSTSWNGISSGPPCGQPRKWTPQTRNGRSL